MRAQRLYLVTLSVAVILATLSGCSWLGNKPDYQKSQESKPLEVPPELDRPSNTSALTVPGAQSSSPESEQTPESTAAPEQQPDS
jgi:uncharacterized lipoprotein